MVLRTYDACCGVGLMVVTVVGLFVVKVVGLAVVVMVDVVAFKTFCVGVSMVAMRHKAKTPEKTHGTMIKIFFMLSLPYTLI